MEVENVVILVTTPALEEARKIAQSLLEQKLAACVSIIPDVSSAFWWQNEIDHTSENLLIIKTRYNLLDTIIPAVKRMHTDTVPEIIALPILGGNRDYFEWMKNVLA